MTYLKPTCGLTALIALSACGGGSTSETAPQSLISANDVRSFADSAGDGSDIQTIGDVLQAGSTLAAREVSEQSWRETYGDNGGYEAFDGVVRFAIDGDDLLVTFGEQGDINADTIRIADAASITEDNLTIENDDIFFGLNVGGVDAIADLFGDDAPDMSRIGIYYNNRDDGFGIQTRSVIGVETRDDRLSDLVSAGGFASYNGYSSFSIRRTDQPWPDYNAGLDGDLELIVDFTDATVSGRMTELYAERRAAQDTLSEGAVAGEIIFEETTFGENAFAGDLTSDAAFTAADPEFAALIDSGTYSGAFYGESASDVGGTTRANATVGEAPLIAQGYFDAD